MRVNGKRAIGIGVASGAKDNVVAVGKAVDERLAEIEQLLPIGIEPVSYTHLSIHHSGSEQHCIRTVRFDKHHPLPSEERTGDA